MSPSPRLEKDPPGELLNLAWERQGWMVVVVGFYSCINNKAQRSLGANPYQMFTLLFIPTRAVPFVFRLRDSALNRYIKSNARRVYSTPNPRRRNGGKKKQ